MSFESDSWSELFDRHGAALVLYARQWAPRRSDAEDIVQEAFIRFWRSRHRVAEPAEFLFACVRHCGLDWQRQRRRQTRRDEGAARSQSEVWFSESSEPGGAMENAERQRTIQAALKTLPAEQREVLVLKIWGKLTFPQIAAALEIPANTASSRYRYALARLREQFAEESVP